MLDAEAWTSYGAIARIDIGVAALIGIASLLKIAASREKRAASPGNRISLRRELRAGLVFLFAGLFFYGLAARNTAAQWVAAAGVGVVLLVPVARSLWTRRHGARGY